MELSLVITGPPKSATTSLDDSLRSCPTFSLPRIKETHFLVSGRLNSTNPYIVREPQQYQALFGESDAVRAEVCPTYFYYPRDVAPKVGEVIVVLRDPLARAISHFLMDYFRFSQFKGVDVFELGLTELRAGRCGDFLGSGLDPYIDLSIYGQLIDDWRASGAKVFFLEDGLLPIFEFLNKRFGVEIVAREHSNSLVHARSRIAGELIKSQIGSVLSRKIGVHFPSLKHWLKSQFFREGQEVQKVVAHNLYRNLITDTFWREQVGQYAQLRHDLGETISGADK